MKVKVTLNPKNIELVRNKLLEALKETADAIESDLKQSQTMPFDTSTLQNQSTFVNDRFLKLGKVTIVSDTPYARRLYFHPEYNFHQSPWVDSDGRKHNQFNKNAGALWFDPYINGNKKDFVNKTFKKIARSMSK